MNYITTTELRTKSSELVNSLKKGEEISLVHRSKVIGKIKPTERAIKPFNPVAFRKLLKDLKPKKLIPRKDREKIYRKNLMEKYGKGLS